MPVDAYTLCPGGTGKKIKFCCPDLLGDHQKIDRMFTGRQFQAALSHVERLEEKHPGRACVMAYRCRLLLLMGRLDEAESVAAKFREHHPTNPLALAETAIVVALKQGGLAAMPWFQRTMDALGSSIPDLVQQMFRIVGQVLADNGEFLPACAVFQLSSYLSQGDEAFEAFERMIQLLGSFEVPLWLKEDLDLAKSPDNAPWIEEFEEAVAMVNRGRWSAAEQRFLALAAQVGDHPALWRNVATMRGWLGNREGYIEALRKYARLDVPLEDAAAAEAKAMFLSADPLGDLDDLVALTYPIVDVQQFEAAVASSQQFRPIPVDSKGPTGDGAPPPLARYLFLDGGHASDESSADPANWPQVVCDIAYHGKETDREARLRLSPVPAAEEQAVQRLLGQVLFGVLGPLAERRMCMRTSRTLGMIQGRWWPPHDLGVDALREALASHREKVLLEQWPDCPLGVLDGKTPLEAAKDPKYRVPLLATILVVEFWARRRGCEIDSNRLRARLGLPTLDPIDPEQVDLASLPASRLARVKEQGLSREKLWQLLQKGIAFNSLPAIRKFGRAVVDHPESKDVHERAEILAVMAGNDIDLRRSLACIEEGRELTESTGASSAEWDLMELRVHILRGDPAEAGRMLRHLLDDHANEPGVMLAVREMLVQHGVTAPEEIPMPPWPAPEEAGLDLAVPSPEGVEPGELWTPEGKSASGDKPKLWVPGMD